VDPTPEDVIQAALDENDGPEDAAAALASDPDRVIVPWRGSMQGFELEALDRHRDSLATLELRISSASPLG
jgi:hypothetical protein